MDNKLIESHIATLEQQKKRNEIKLDELNSSLTEDKPYTAHLRTMQKIEAVDHAILHLSIKLSVLRGLLDEVNQQS